MIWPFTEKHAPMGEPELTAALTKRLDALCDRQDKFERVVKDLRLEWDEMYDKMRLLYARASKRIKDAARAADEGADDTPETHHDAPGSTFEHPAGIGRPLAPRIPRSNYGR